MNQKRKRQLLVVVLIILTLFWAFRKFYNVPQNVVPVDAKIEYSKHALCRMQCRSITEEDIHNVLKTGVLKQTTRDKRGKRYKILGKSRDKNIIVIMAKNEGEAAFVLVTTYENTGKENDPCETDCR